MKIGFDNEKYLKLQSENISKRISCFDNKLYLEFGGKLFDDYHASRVLPGFQPDSKLQMLLKLKDKAEIIISINAEDITRNKIRNDYGITYDNDVIRLINEFTNIGLYVSSVCITKYYVSDAVLSFENRIKEMNINVYHHFVIDGYPNNVSKIVSENGYGKNDYIKTSRPLVVVTAPGPGSGKCATCLSQLYHDFKHGIKSGYAKFETFPIWNLPLKHPVNIAYEAATSDLNDMNMIDSFHLEHYGVSTVNYNRDIEIFPVVNAMLEMIQGESIYHSPTDMGVNMIGYCISGDDVCCKAAKREIVRRYNKCLVDIYKHGKSSDNLFKLELLIKQANLTDEDMILENTATKIATETGKQVVAIKLHDGTIITGKTSELLGAASSCLLNAIKYLANIDDPVYLLDRSVIEPIEHLKITYLGSHNPRMHSDEALIALSASSYANELAEKALEKLPELKGCEGYSTVVLSSVDERVYKKLGIRLSCNPDYKNNQ